MKCDSVAPGLWPTFRTTGCLAGTGRRGTTSEGDACDSVPPRMTRAEFGRMRLATLRVEPIASRTDAVDMVLVREEEGRKQLDVNNKGFTRQESQS